MIQGENECSFGMDREEGELGDEVIGSLSWFTYKAPTIAL
jgi:hypothetical protein